MRMKGILAALAILALTTPAAAQVPRVQAFREWLLTEVAREPETQNAA